MNEVTIRILSNIFIISGIVLFIAAVVLAILRHKERSSHVISYDIRQKGSYMPKNRRTHERIEYPEEVRFSHPEAPYEEGAAMGRDINLGGAGLLVPINVKIKAGAKIDLELFFEGEDEPVGVIGEIVWAEGLEDDRMERLSLISEFFSRRVGIKFVEVDEENGQKIEIFVSGLSQRKT